MSRSKRGGKGAGFEYWSARPGNKAGGGHPGAETKLRTHRTERQQGKRDARLESRQAAY